MDGILDKDERNQSMLGEIHSVLISTLAKGENLDELTKTQLNAMANFANAVPNGKFWSFLPGLATSFQDHTCTRHSDQIISLLHVRKRKICSGSTKQIRVLS